MASIVEKLQAYESAWKQADTDQEKTGFTKPPAGDHKAVLKSAQMGESKGASKRLQVTWKWRIYKGEHINKEVVAWDSLEDDSGLSAIRGRLVAHGVTPPKSLVAGLVAALDEACDRKVLIRVSYVEGRPDFPNVLVIKRLGLKAEAAPPPKPTAEDDEDI